MQCEKCSPAKMSTKNQASRNFPDQHCFNVYLFFLLHLTVDYGEVDAESLCVAADPSRGAGVSRDHHTVTVIRDVVQDVLGSVGLIALKCRTVSW